MGSRTVRIGNLTIGGDAPVRVESMLTSSLENLDSCINEVESLVEEGCELIRVAFPLKEHAPALEELLRNSPVPLMGDIHFDEELAVEALRRGCPSIRINPGNMRKGISRVVQEARKRGAVLRIGANGGSLNGEQIAKASGDVGLALVGAVEEQLAILEEENFRDIILSAKATNIGHTLRANQLLASRYSYPLHIGITEAGSGIPGIAKSACGLGLLLSQGIGDTLRVSLTGPSPEEVRVGYAVLRALDLRRRGPSLISCPTCGRRKIDVFAVVTALEPLLRDLPEDLEIAVMGCEVNGPREAAGADMGVAGTPSGAAFFSKGTLVKRMKGQDPEDIARELREIARELRK